MKKFYSLISVSFIIAVFMCNVNAQTTIAGWTIPSGDGSANLGLPVNTTFMLEGMGITVDYTKNGYDLDATTKAAQGTGWDNGDGTKFWQIQVNTTGYSTIKLSSRQNSGGANPGPKYFKLGYKIGAGGTWTTIKDGSNNDVLITTANDWTTAYVNNLELPAECNDQTSVFIRWIMYTNESTSSTPGSPVTSAGVNKIDEVYVTGTSLSGINSMSTKTTIYPNPAYDEKTTISSETLITKIRIFDISGKLIQEQTPGTLVQQIQLPKGMYFIEITDSNGVSKKKVISL
jgi:hypothetical protein